VPGRARPAFKRADLLLAAFALVRRERPDARLVVPARRPEPPRASCTPTSTTTPRCSTRTAARTSPRSPRAARRSASSSSSRWRAGTPAVASADAAGPEVVGDAGLTFDGDEPSALAHALLTALDGPDPQACRRQAERLLARALRRAARGAVPGPRAPTDTVAAMSAAVPSPLAARRVHHAVAEPLRGGARREQWKGVQQLIAHAEKLLEGRTLWCINSTAKGGGVAEMLESLLAYTSGAGIDSRWLVISGEPEFFRITKRIHNRLHGAEGDGGPARRRRAHAYEAALEPNKPALADTSRPATSSSSTTRSPPGWSPRSRSSTSSSSGGCTSAPTRSRTTSAAPGTSCARTSSPPTPWVFSRDAFAWDGLDAERTFTIAPSIDVFAPKNEDLDDDEVRAILVAAGLLDGDAPAPEHAIERRADVLEERPLPADRPDGPAGLALGRAQGPPRRAQGVRRAHRAAPRRRPRARRPVVEGVSDDPRAPTSSSASRTTGAPCPTTSASASTSPRCRWTTTTRTRGWSTRCSATPRSSCRSRWPRASA
jgi:hypothetical protein